MGRRAVRVELNGAFEIFLRHFEIPIVRESLDTLGDGARHTIILGDAIAQVVA